MKKLLLIIVALFGLHSYAQKKLEIYNFTTNLTILIPEITTDDSGAFPEFRANLGTIGPITIPPGGSYILENTSTPLNLTRFPFDSTGGPPYIPSWYEVVSPTNITDTLSSAAWPLGDPQVFARLGFRILDPAGTTGFGTLTPTNTLISSSTTTNWNAIYDSSTIGTAITYTVVFVP